MENILNIYKEDDKLIIASKDLMFQSSQDKLKKYEDAARDCSILYLAENSKYQEALQLISQTQFDKSPEILIATAACYIGLNKYTKALEILCHAEKLGWLLPDIISMKGRILFRLNKFEQAKMAFETYEKIYSRNKNTSLWLLRCTAHITLEQDPSQARIVTIENHPEQTEVRSDWFQTSTTISMILFISHLTEEQLNVVFNKNSVEVKVNAAIHYHHIFYLSKEIVPEESKIEITPSKVELKMKKALTEKWKALESKL
ncbi:CS domain containing protein [Tritrichomonas foetus]|uniref:CS domain containing protein n=1 Tax=Tritrichomonas foetus TaxID=1144522 RepID=A0A1J4KU94_9EUKA|nr:CS domain containing protein [Tritrichomonas foetus]|eukprot:OHT14849.1 CS domain containing protein [Tritrichomonas foetus]